MSIKRLNKILGIVYLVIIPLFFFINEGCAMQGTSQVIWLNESYSDSLRFDAINEFHEKHIHVNPTAVLELVGYHYSLAQQKNSDEEIENALNYKVNALKMLGEYDDALEELASLIAIKSSQKDTIGLANAYRLSGSIYHYQSKYLKAVQDLTESLRLYQLKNYEDGQTRAYISLANVYSEINNLDVAMDFYDKAIGLARKHNQLDHLNSVLINVGFIKYKRKKYVEAVTKCYGAKKYFISTNNQVCLADIYYLLAQSYHALNSQDSALFYITKTVDTNLAIGNNGQIIPSKLLMANILYPNNRKEAVRMVEDILPSIDNEFGYQYLADAHNLLYRCYKDQGNLPRALNMLEKYTVYNDSLIIEEDDLAITYQTLQAEHEIELLNTQLENEKSQSKLEYNQLIKTFSILLLSALIIFLTIIYARTNYIKQKLEKEELLLEIRELKDREKNALDLVAPKFQLNRDKIEKAIDKKINETDWNVLNILLDDPVISNKDIATKVFLTVDGIGSSLRRMYVTFEIKESKYKKISLIMKAIKLSNRSSDIVN